MDGSASMQDTQDVASSLQTMGLIEPGEPIVLVALGGGVSCDVWRVETARGTVCVKRALARLRVAADWRAPAERSTSEVAWMRLVSSFEPRWAPRVLGEDVAQNLFAMEFLPPQSHPVWKTRLADGVIDPVFAGRVGSAMARIHAFTARRADIANQFANGEQFHALRLDPYLLYTAGKHPDVADIIRDLVRKIADARIALMHGDVSPKNILCGPTGPVFIDAETTCYGDPAFDLAFCLNHLLLKGVWHPQWIAKYLECFASLRTHYLAGVDWEPSSSLDMRAARLLPALLLARIDGKSPVEYLTDYRDKEFVRATALALLGEPSTSLDEIRTRWLLALRVAQR